MKENSTITVNTNIEADARVSRAYLPWFVWGLGAAFFLVEYFARVRF